MDETPQPTPPQPVHHTWEFALGISVLMILMVGVVYVYSAQKQQDVNIEPIAEEQQPVSQFNDVFLNATYSLPVLFVKGENTPVAQMKFAAGQARPEEFTACTIVNYETGKILAATIDQASTRGVVAVYCNYGASRTDVFLVAFDDLTGTPRQTDQIETGGRAVQEMTLAANGLLKVTVLQVPENQRNLPRVEQSTTEKVFLNYTLNAQGKIVANTSQPSTITSTANWKTYTNTEYGFEFKNPPSWQNAEGTGDGYVMFQLSLAWSRGDHAAWMSIVAESDIEKAIARHVNQYVAGTKIEKREKIVVGGVKGELVFINITGRSSDLDRWVFLPHGGKTYIIGITFDVAPYDTEFDQLLSTFKFTN